ncbi:hypothetical protein CLV00_2309 [Flavobacterium sp. 11]|nr:hypothetical protein CLV00_2309 [Flavobacterium sp. 11]
MPYTDRFRFPLLKQGRQTIDNPISQVNSIDICKIESKLSVNG